MFGRFKEKLKSWFTSSKEKVEETAEKKEIKIEEKPKEEKPKPKEKPEKIKEDKKKTKTIKETPEIKPEEEHAIKIETEIEEGVPQEIIEEEIKHEISEKEAKKADKLIEEAKKQKIPEPPLKFEVAKQKYEPDLEKISIKQRIQELEKEEAKLEKKSFFSRLKSTFSYKITEEGFNEIFEDLEILLLENNVALEVVENIQDILSKKLIGKEIPKDNLEQEIRAELKNTLNEILIEPDNPLEVIKSSKKPFVILFFGINGTGKTTSIAKIAYYLKLAGFSVVLAAADTFRAASIEQLSEHASKLKVPILKQDYKSDPAAVGFDAIKYAEKHKIDVVLIDTAGRMHTKTNLLSEMEKICRVTNPGLKIFVAESIAGNDATEQARAFNETIEIDGTILTKADIDEKGGTIISISHATNKPIFYLGTGQNYKDLEIFNKQKFIESLGL